MHFIILSNNNEKYSLITNILLEYEKANGRAQYELDRTNFSENICLIYISENITHKWILNNSEQCMMHKDDAIKKI